MFFFNAGICLVFGEALLRVDGPVYIKRRVSIDVFNRRFLFPGKREPGTTLKPGVNGWIYGHMVRTNSLGFRGGEIAPPRPGEKRILVIGRSLAFGWGVPERAAWPFRLERMLNREGGREYRVINLSIPAWTLADVFVSSFKYSGMFKPHMLILPLYTDDLIFYEELKVYLEELGRLKAAPGQKKNGLSETIEKVLNYFTQSSMGENLCLKQIIVNLWYDVLIKRNMKRMKSTLSPEKFRESTIVLLKAVEIIRNWCVKKGIAFLVLDMGGTRELKEFCSLEGIDYQDCKIDWESCGVPCVLGFGDPHPNEFGHSLIAKRVFKTVKRILDAGGKK